MNTDDKIKLFAKTHNMRRGIRYEEIQPFFKDGYSCVQHGAYLAACLCFIAGIEMSLRLPLLFNEGLSVKDAYHNKKIPWLSNGLLKLAQDQGLPIELLKFVEEGDDLFSSNNLTSDDHKARVRIVRLRNNICHGNLSIFVREVESEERIYVVDFKKEALQLETIAMAWAKAYGEWLAE